MPDKNEMSDSEHEEIQASDEDMVNQELEDLKNDSPSPSPSPQVRKQTFLISLKPISYERTVFYFIYTKFFDEYIAFPFVRSFMLPSFYSCTTKIRNLSRIVFIINLLNNSSY